MCGTDHEEVIGWEKQNCRQYLSRPRGRALRKDHQVAKAHFNSVSVGALCVRKHGKWFRRQRLTRCTNRDAEYDEYCDCGSTLKR
jgi:hypothetical protein